MLLQYFFFFSAKAQLISMPFSLFSLTSSSVKLFYSQRVGRYRDIDPSMKSMALVGFPIFFRNLGFLSIWVVITAYLQGYAIPCVLLVMLIVFLAFSSFTSLVGWDELLDMSFDSFDRSLLERKVNETRKIFSTSVFTAWVAPCTVWSHKKLFKTNSNNSSGNSCLTNFFLKLKENFFSSFLMLTSYSTIFGLLVCLAITSVNLHQTHTTFSSNNNAPVTHCFKNDSILYDQNNFVYSTSAFIKICYFRPCKSVVRVCDENKNETDVFFHWVLTVLIAVLVLEVILYLFCVKN